MIFLFIHECNRWTLIFISLCINWLEKGGKTDVRSNRQYKCLPGLACIPFSANMAYLDLNACALTLVVHNFFRNLSKALLLSLSNRRSQVESKFPSYMYTILSFWVPQRLETIQRIKGSFNRYLNLKARSVCLLLTHGNKQ